MGVHSNGIGRKLRGQLRGDRAHAAGGHRDVTLRKHFENGAEAIAAAALSRLARDGKFDKKRAQAAIAELGLDPESPDPVKK